MTRRLKIYLANPLGFTRSPELEAIKEALEAAGFEVYEPFEWAMKNHSDEISELFTISDYQYRVAMATKLGKDIGHDNEVAIRNSDILVAVLDGDSLDSGTVSELGFAAGVGRRCYGLRRDLRNVGDFDGLPINLQVHWWIQMHGGTLCRNTKDLIETINFDFRHIFS